MPRKHKEDFFDWLSVVTENNNDLKSSFCLAITFMKAIYKQKHLIIISPTTFFNNPK